MEPAPDQPVHVAGTLTATMPPLPSVGAGTVAAATAGTLIAVPHLGGLPNLVVDGIHFLIRGGRRRHR